ncbi:lytic transglycosylase domain-containing protein [Dactylosporangium sp. CA-092794]|uniref:lytic transglycosylase domain-containing protein n=1 Tax=Dactylosporangium sp. CA-092794 TaxID=3239929 RepID=UPI003D939F78
MASDDEVPEADRPATVDDPAATVIRPPVPRHAADEQRLPVEIIAPKPQPQPKPQTQTQTQTQTQLAATAGPQTPHQPKHAVPDPPAVDVMESRRRALDERRERFNRARSRPGARFLLPGLLIAVVLAAAGVAGAVVVPAASRPQADPSFSAPPPEGTNGAPPATDAPATGEAPRPETPSGSSSYSPPPGTRQRPADVYGAWAGARSVRLDIPVVALQAYGYAEAVTARTTPKCKLTWTTLAGIAKVESNHGRTGGSVLQDDGRSVPPIVGPPLDGQNNRQAVADTDQGALDGDRSWDRAVGPMQFLPATWKQYGLDADGDGTADVNDIDDAALTAAAYLCEGGRDLSTLDGWNAAIHAYNVPEEYRAAVFNATNDYGRRDRQS